MKKKNKVVNLHNYELQGVVMKLSGKEYEFIKQWTENSKDLVWFRCDFDSCGEEFSER